MASVTKESEQPSKLSKSSSQQKQTQDNELPTEDDINKDVTTGEQDLYT